MTAFDTAVQDLLSAVPEFLPSEQRLDAEDLDLEFIIYGRFATFLRDRCALTGIADPVLKKSLDFLESLAASGNEGANLVQVGVLEVLGDIDRGEPYRTQMTELLAIMGPTCAYLFRSVEALWTATTEEFERLPPDHGLDQQWPPPPAQE